MVQFSKKEFDFLTRYEIGRLATVSTHGIPHVAAICYAHDEERIYLHTTPTSKKGRNIQRNRHVSFIVDEYLKWEDFQGVLVHGEAAFRKAGPLHEQGRNLIYRKYPKWKETYPITRGEPVLVIEPTEIISWGLR